jgi:hypothetical protein
MPETAAMSVLVEKTDTAFFSDLEEKAVSESRQRVNLAVFRLVAGSTPAKIQLKRDRLLFL